ncbi:MAG: LytTR family DNA-binding domain-containing protein [Paludibacter sp.]
MIQQFLGSTSKIIQFGLILVVYTLLQTYVVYWLLPIPLWQILLDSLFQGMLFGIIAALLRNVFKYGNFEALTVFQRILNHIALGLISLSIWMSVGFGLFYWLFGNELAAHLIPILPLRGFIGLLIYLLVIQRFQIELLDANHTNNEIDNSLELEKIQPVNNIKSELLERIAVKSGSKIHVIMISEILFLQADGDYVQIITINGKYLKEQTMKFFEEHLPENQFVRVHRSCIVNVEMISRIELYEKQNQLISLKNGIQIKTSPAGYKALRLALKL